VTYDRYIASMRLTHNGRRGREQMSAAEREEWDGLGITEASAPDREEARRAYLDDPPDPPA
jgi:hypothetical protein